MNVEVRQLLEYIKKKEFNQAIIYLDKNKDFFKKVLPQDSNILIKLASIPFKTERELELNIRSLWRMEILQFQNYLQWLPEEILVDMIELQTQLNVFLSLFNLLLALGASINSKDGWKETPLHKAAESGNEVIASLLIESGAKVNAKNGKVETPLHMAVKSGNGAIVALLIESGAKVNAINWEGKTPLYLAVKSGNGAIVALLLKNDAGVYDEKGGRGKTPFDVAVENANVPIVTLLIKSKSGVNAKYWKDGRALLDAVRSGSEVIVALLLENGANVNAMYTRNTLLPMAIERGSEAIVALLLKNGADVNPICKDKIPLYVAIRKGSAAIAALLIRNGADVKVMNEEKESLLHVAVRVHLIKLMNKNSYETLQIISLLLNRGTDIDARDAKGNTPLFCVMHNNELCADNSWLNIARLLIESGADIKATNERKESLLHVVARNADYEMAQLLKRADVNAQNAQRETPLHKVVKRFLEFCQSGLPRDRTRSSYRGIMVLLLQMGADANLQDENGKSPKDYLLEHGFADVYESIMQSVDEVKQNIVASQDPNDNSDLSLSLKLYGISDPSFNQLHFFLGPLAAIEENEFSPEGSPRLRK